jgi:protoheme IX farnesyltransferase
MFKEYYNLAKPGIVYGNIFTTLAGFLFASRWHFSPLLLVATMVGLALVIGSACVFNNYFDRDIDRKMQRTRDRALAVGAISARRAISYGALLGLVGFFLLGAYVNILTAAIALFGFIFYVAIYGLAKRTSHWGTIVGSVSGAVPIIVGYTAVTGRLDMTALMLFLILAFWQMPHFYAIAIYRLEDYVAAGIPVLPARKGMKVTKIYIVSFIIAFIIATVTLAASGNAGYVYLAIVLALGLSWLARAIAGFKAYDDSKWARKLFFFSLIVLVGFSLALSVAWVLPLY